MFIAITDPDREIVPLAATDKEAAMKMASDYLAENCADGHCERVFVIESIGAFRLNPSFGGDEPITLPI